MYTPSRYLASSAVGSSSSSSGLNQFRMDDYRPRTTLHLDSQLKELETQSTLLRNDEGVRFSCRGLERKRSTNAEPGGSVTISESTVQAAERLLARHNFQIQRELAVPMRNLLAKAESGSGGVRLLAKTGRTRTARLLPEMSRGLSLERTRTTVSQRRTVPQIVNHTERLQQSNIDFLMGHFDKKTFNQSFLVQRQIALARDNVAADVKPSAKALKAFAHSTRVAYSVSNPSECVANFASTAQKHSVLHDMWRELSELTTYLYSQTASGAAAVTPWVQATIATRRLLEKKFQYRVLCDCSGATEHNIESVAASMPAKQFRAIARDFTRKMHKVEDEWLTTLTCLKSGRYDAAALVSTSYDGVQIVHKALTTLEAASAEERQFFACHDVLRLSCEGDDSVQDGPHRQAVLMFLCHRLDVPSRVERTFERVARDVCLFADDYIWFRLCLLTDEHNAGSRLASLQALQFDVQNSTAAFLAESTNVTPAKAAMRLVYVQLWNHALGLLRRTTPRYEVVHVAVGLMIADFIDFRGNQIFSLDDELRAYLEDVIVPNVSTPSPTQDQVSLVRATLPYLLLFDTSARGTVAAKMCHSPANDNVCRHLVGYLGDSGVVECGEIFNNEALSNVVDSMMETAAATLVRMGNHRAALDIWVVLWHIYQRKSDDTRASCCAQLVLETLITHMSRDPRSRSDAVSVDYDYATRVLALEERTCVEVSSTLRTNFITVHRIVQVHSHLEAGDIKAALEVLHSMQWMPTCVEELLQTSTTYAHEAMDGVVQAMKPLIARVLSACAEYYETHTGANGVRSAASVLYKWVMSHAVVQRHGESYTASLSCHHQNAFV